MNASPPPTVRRELRRIAAGRARFRAAARAGRWHLAILAGACVLAFVHRAVRPLPGLADLTLSWPVVLGAAAALIALGPALWFAFAVLVPREGAGLARELDDRFGWHDDTDTAASLPADADDTGLAALVVAQTGGRLREIDPRTLAGAGRPWGRVRLALVLLFIAVLLLPGVGGIFGGAGAGTDGGDGPGTAGDEQDFGTPGPMRADFWFQAFVENPIPVEPLPAADAPAQPEGDR